MTLRHFPCTPSGWSGTGLIYEESQLIFTTTLTYVVDFLKYTLSCSHGQEEAHPPPQKRQKLAQICRQSDSVTTIHTLHFICGWNKKAQKHCYNHFKRFTSSCVKIGRLNTIPVGNVATIIVYKITSHCEGTVQMREESQSGIRKWEEIIDIARIFCWGADNWGAKIKTRRSVKQVLEYLELEKSQMIATNLSYLTFLRHIFSHIHIHNY